MRITVFLTAILMGVVAFATELPLPVVPDSLRTPSDRATYIMLHFWDGMDWSDSTLTGDDSFMEQNSANFYSLFSLTDSIHASAAVEIMLRGAATDMTAYKRVADIAALYLHEPYSPMIDDESYAVVVDRLLKDQRLGDADMLRLEDIHGSLMRNRKGLVATDFEIITREGKTIRMSEAAALKPRSLLIFYDPDCHDCAMLEQYLATACPEDTGVVMVSFLGEQDGLWKQHATKLPSHWTVAMTADDDFEDAELYDIAVTPTVYLLDRNCIILSKNLTINSIPHLLINE